jgi:Transposase and inactivated derivatives
MWKRSGFYLADPWAETKTGCFLWVQREKADFWNTGWS